MEKSSIWGLFFSAVLPGWALILGSLLCGCGVCACCFCWQNLLVYYSPMPACLAVLSEAVWGLESLEILLCKYRLEYLGASSIFLQLLQNTQ